MAKKQFVVIGIGLFGEAIARSLAQNGAEVMIIDSNQERVDYLADSVAYAVALDSTDKNALMSQNVQNFDAAVISIGEDFENLLLTAVNLMELNVKRIIVRAKGDINRKILEKLGLTEIFSPEHEVGSLVAERLMNPNIFSYLQLPDQYRIAEIKTPKNLIGKRLGLVNLRDSYNLSLITIKNQVEVKKNETVVTEEHIVGVPSSLTIVKENDFLVLFGKNKDIDRFIEINA